MPGLKIAPLRQGSRRPGNQDQLLKCKIRERGRGLEKAGGCPLGRGQPPVEQTHSVADHQGLLIRLPMAAYQAP